MDRKKLIKLLYPTVWIIALLVALCAASLVLVFINKMDAHPAAYFVYVLSFYTLTVVVVRCIKTAPRYYHAARDKVYSDPVGKRYMTDMRFRAHASLYSSLVINLLYVVFNVVFGILNHTAWFFVLAFYYTTLAVMRFLLLRFIGRVGIGNDRFRELCRSRLCGYILLVIELALSGAVLMILYQNKGHEYHGILIYVMAAYTFYITTLAIINLVKYRRLGSPVMSMSKMINMAAALVSMLSLETAMFSAFGQDMSVDNKRLFIMLTGAGVSIIIVSMSVYSIVKNSREIKRIMEETHG